MDKTTEMPQLVVGDVQPSSGPLVVGSVQLQRSQSAHRLHCPVPRHQTWVWSSLSFSLTVSSHSTNMLCASLQITDGGTWQETDNLSVYNTNYSLEGLQPSTSYQARVVVPIHYSHQICLRMKKLFILFYYQGGDERRKGSAIRSCR
jgi:hypothetical protein